MEGDREVAREGYNESKNPEGGREGVLLGHV